MEKKSLKINTTFYPNGLCSYSFGKVLLSLFWVGMYVSCEFLSHATFTPPEGQLRVLLFVLFWKQTSISGYVSVSCSRQPPRGYHVCQLPATSSTAASAAQHVASACRRTRLFLLRLPATCSDYGWRGSLAHALCGWRRQHSFENRFSCLKLLPWTGVVLLPPLVVEWFSGWDKTTNACEVS